jgi:hypothetical protein
MIACLRLKYAAFTFSHHQTLANRLNKATEALDHVLHQCNALLVEIESIFPIQGDHSNAEDRGYQHSSIQDFRLDSTDTARVDYLKAHLDSIRLTLSVMSQTMYTAQSIMWTRYMIPILYEDSGI